MFALLALFVLTCGGIVLVGVLGLSALLIKVVLKGIFLPLALAFALVKVVMVITLAAVLFAVIVPLAIVVGVLALPFFVLASIF